MSPFTYYLLTCNWAGILAEVKLEGQSKQNVMEVLVRKSYATRLSLLANSLAAQQSPSRARKGSCGAGSPISAMSRPIAPARPFGQFGGRKEAKSRSEQLR